MTDQAIELASERLAEARLRRKARELDVARREQDLVPREQVEAEWRANAIEARAVIEGIFDNIRKAFPEAGPLIDAEVEAAFAVFRDANAD